MIFVFCPSHNPLYQVTPAAEELHRPHPQPQPQGAPRVRQEGDQGERGDERLRDPHLLVQGKFKHWEVFPLSSTKKLPVYLLETDRYIDTIKICWYLSTLVDLQGFGQFDSTVPSNKLSKSIGIAELL